MKKAGNQKYRIYRILIPKVSIIVEDMNILKPLTYATKKYNTMPIPQELNYDMWLGPAWEAPYTENRVHAQKAYGRPGWMRVDSYCNGMISNWGAHLMGIAQWGNNTLLPLRQEVSLHGIPKKKTS